MKRSGADFGMYMKNGGIKEVAGIDEQSDRNRREDS